MHLFLQTPGQQARWRVQTKLKRFLCWIALSCFISTPMAFAQNPVVFSLPDSLTGTAGDTITVDVTATTATDAAGYWLLARPAHTIRWQVFATVPLTQTTYLLRKPEAGSTYEFIVAAQDELGTTVAESAHVRYAAVDEPQARRIYLPVVRK